MLVFILAAFVILAGLIIVFNLLQRRSQPQTEAPAVAVSPIPTLAEPPISPVPEESPAFQSKQNLPTYPPDKGQGVDLESPVVQTSIAEIEKLYPYLPYLRDYQVSTGLTVSIVIPAKDLQGSPWTLLVQIFGIDYNVPSGSEEYERMKTSFLEAANSVFEWMRSNQVDPQKIFISWGDRALIQDRAEEWLTSP